MRLCKLRPASCSTHLLVYSFSQNSPCTLREAQSATALCFSLSFTSLLSLMLNCIQTYMEQPAGWAHSTKNTCFLWIWCTFNYVIKLSRLPSRFFCYRWNKINALHQKTDQVFPHKLSNWKYYEIVSLCTTSRALKCWLGIFVVRFQLVTGTWPNRSVITTYHFSPSRQHTTQPAWRTLAYWTCKYPVPPSVLVAIVA